MSESSSASSPPTRSSGGAGRWPSSELVAPQQVGERAEPRSQLLVGLRQGDRLGHERAHRKRQCPALDRLRDAVDEVPASSRRHEPDHVDVGGRNSSRSSRSRSPSAWSRCTFSTGHGTSPASSCAGSGHGPTLVGRPGGRSISSRRGGARRRRSRRGGSNGLEARARGIPCPTSIARRSSTSGKAGFNADHDHNVSDEVRFVQLTPPAPPARSRSARASPMRRRGPVRHADGRSGHRGGARGARGAWGRPASSRLSVGLVLVFADPRRGTSGPSSRSSLVSSVAGYSLADGEGEHVAFSEAGSSSRPPPTRREAPSPSRGARSARHAAPRARHEDELSSCSSGEHVFEIGDREFAAGTRFRGVRASGVPHAPAPVARTGRFLTLTSPAGLRFFPRARAAEQSDEP